MKDESWVERILMSRGMDKMMAIWILVLVIVLPIVVVLGFLNFIGVIK